MCRHRPFATTSWSVNSIVIRLFPHNCFFAPLSRNSVCRCLIFRLKFYHAIFKTFCQNATQRVRTSLWKCDTACRGPVLRSLRPLFNCAKPPTCDPKRVHNLFLAFFNSKLRLFAVEHQRRGSDHDCQLLRERKVRCLWNLRRTLSVLRHRGWCLLVTDFVRSHNFSAIFSVRLNG